MFDTELEKSQYEYLRNMGIEGWTWEFIRRSPDYQKAWQRYATCPRLITNTHHPLTIGRREMKAASQFGLLFFRNPNRDAEESFTFWSPSHNPFVLKCNATPRDGRDRSLGTNLNNLSCNRTLIRTNNNQFHLLLSSSNRSLQLIFDQHIDLNNLFYFEIISSGPGILKQQAEAVLCLDTLLRRGSFSQSFFAMPARFRMRPRLLNALDLAEYGLSQREIARRIYGQDAILKGWDGISHHIKSRTYRLIKKGHNLLGESHRIFFDLSRKD